MTMNLVSQAEQTQTLADECRAFVSNYNGDNYFEDVALFLAEKVGCSYVLIGHLLPEDQNKIRTVVLAAKGKLVNNMTYSLFGTPCENVVGRNCCYFPTGVRYLFPDDKELQDLNIESYIGSPLFTKDKKPLGLIVLMNETIIKDAKSIEKALSILAERTEKEMLALPLELA